MWMLGAAGVKVTFLRGFGWVGKGREVGGDEAMAEPGEIPVWKVRFEVI